MPKMSLETPHPGGGKSPLLVKAVDLLNVLWSMALIFALALPIGGAAMYLTRRIFGLSAFGAALASLPLFCPLVLGSAFLGLWLSTQWRFDFLKRLSKPVGAAYQVFRREHAERIDFIDCVREEARYVVIICYRAAPRVRLRMLRRRTGGRHCYGRAVR